ncbi:hypothetical protein [Chamaesiphon sp. VAR_48_metabat_403]|uniref:hypothetical protein n=1 Tax=Chamaesiphon sp. VAR_48_metabat_403 TaxID=2964700 RepID=UPI00286E3566|nr:hypothetical protein [Chamaesiphon sp. VAR_48_metabat_403]
MKTAIGNLAIGMWIVASLWVDLWLGTMLMWTVSTFLSLTEGGPFRKATPYAMPIHEVLIYQISTSLLCLFIGLAWAGIVLVISERLLVLLKSNSRSARQFQRLSTILYILAIGAIVIGITIGNAIVYYDQIQGRAAFDRVKVYLDNRAEHSYIQYY